MAKGKKTGGRKPGSKNKIGADVRESILTVYAELGGDKAFAEWAKNNQKDFFWMYSKLLPKDVNVDATVRLEDIVGGVDNPDGE